MAQHVEPMDIDSDFDNKENSLHHNNVLPFTEKGYDELDVSELNMKLRYSTTPASSPMSKSYTANCFDNRSLESGDDSLNITVNENVNLTRSLNSTMTKSDNVLKSLKQLPLKTINTEQFTDNNRNASVLRPLESAASPDNGNITVTVSAPCDIDENLSLPSSSSSTIQTPEATTPTKDIPHKDGGSPIMRGLKSVFSMFRSSQSPIPPSENDNIVKPQNLSHVEESVSSVLHSQAVLASTPITAHRKKEMTPTKMCSPQKGNKIVFNEDLEKELQWKDETTIIFSQERIPIHKLMFDPQHSHKNYNKEATGTPAEDVVDFNSTVEYMDISNSSFRDSSVMHADNKSIDITLGGDSDTEFVDCETTFPKNEENVIADADTTPVGDITQDLNITNIIEKTNDSGSRLRQIILDTTQDILDATLSVRPEDLLPEDLDQTKDVTSASTSHINQNKTIEISTKMNESSISTVEALTMDLNNTNILTESSVQPVDQTFDVTNITIKNENVDVINTEDNTLDITLKDAEVLNTAEELVPQDSKSVDTNVASISLPTNDVIEQKETKIISSLDVNESPIPSRLPIKSDQSIDEVQSGDAPVICEASMTDLPADIPLPDDDLDKELVLSTDTTEPINFNFEETKLPVAETVPQTVNIAPLTTTAIEENPTVHGDNIELGESEIAIQPEIVTKTNMNNDNVELPANTENVPVLQEDSPLLNKSANESKTATESKAIDNSTQGNSNENVNIDIKTDPETGCKPSPLPDIVNEIIKLPESYIEIPSIIPDDVKLAKLPDNVVNVNSTIIKDEILSTITDKIDTQSFIVDKTQPIIDTSDSHKILIPNSDVAENEPEEATHMSCTIDHVVATSESVNDLIQEEENNVANDHCLTDIEDKSSSSEVPNLVGNDTKVTEEEVVMSGNNSPFTLVAAESSLDDEINLKNRDTLETKTKVILTPPNSPPIRSKGYNFNFDDLDFDPFATKTNIRMSPPFDSPTNPSEAKMPARSVEKPVPKKENRRKTQFDRKKATTSKAKLNSTYCGSSSDKNLKTVDTCLDKSDVHLSGDNNILPSDSIGLNPNNDKIDNIIVPDEPTKTQEISVNNSDTVIKSNLKCSETEEVMSPEDNASSIESNLFELKATSSSEQSTYCTASDTSIASRNVFNLPEIDDINFNPFATMSKMRQSPPPVLNAPTNSSPISPLESVEKAFGSEDKLEKELMEKNVSGDLSSTTISSKGTDERNVTAKEVHTEDEDTVEGPFLEMNEFSPEDKMSDFEDDNMDMMQFNELPTQSNEANLDNGEMFIDAEAFEFLLNQNKSNTVVDSGKESLFLKFDPLFAKRMSAITSDNVVASLAKLQNRQSTPTKVDETQSLNSPTAGPSNLNVTRDLDITNSEDSTDDINVTISKPMMVVPPAVNPVTPRNKPVTPNRPNRRSITFTSPAMAVIDRLLSLSGNSSTLYDTTVTQVSREQNEADIALSQLRELLAEKEINVYNLRSESNELRDRLNTLESHVRSLETESQDRLKKINDLNETLAEKTNINKKMAAVVEEYERTIASLISETALDKKRHAEERIKLINERDEQTAHLASMEVSFSDLHSKYEKSKQIILNCKANEEAYKKSIKEFEENFSKMQNNYELLKQHATSKLNHANQEMEKINRAHEAEVLKLNAMIKRKELHITSLEESLIQKTKANEELTSICDELINKVG